jgi:hypothetical protein
MSFKNKLVALINKDIEPGVAMNALAHMSIGIGSTLKASELELDNYIDQNSNYYPNISRMPFIILRAKSSEIRKSVNSAREQNIKFGVFINTMTGGGYQEQLENTRGTPEESLTYYGAVLFGDFDKVSQITKRFSLLK